MDFVKNLYRYKRLRHIAVGRHLLHDIAFSVHGLFCMEDKGLPRARLLRIVADLPNSIARHLMFQLSTSSRGFCCGSFPSAPHRGHVPIVVRQNNFKTNVNIDRKPRPDVRKDARGIVIRIRIRHTAIRIRAAARPKDHTGQAAALVEVIVVVRGL